MKYYCPRITSGSVTKPGPDPADFRLALMICSKKKWLGRVSWQTMGKFHTECIGKQSAAAQGYAAHDITLPEMKHHD